MEDNKAPEWLEKDLSELENEPYQNNIVYDYFFPFVGRSIKHLAPILLGVATGLIVYYTSYFSSIKDLKIYDQKINSENYIVIENVLNESRSYFNKNDKNLERKTK